MKCVATSRRTGCPAALPRARIRISSGLPSSETSRGVIAIADAPREKSSDQRVAAQRGCAGIAVGSHRPVLVFAKPEHLVFGDDGRRCASCFSLDESDIVQQQRPRLVRASFHQDGDRLGRSVDLSIVGAAPMSRPFVKRHQHFHPATTRRPQGFLQCLIGLVGVPQCEPMAFRDV